MIKSIVLIGMPGCGKSVIGEIIAEKIKMTFIDLDTYISESTKSTIAELFENGEESFRDIESKVVVELSEKAPVLIATGGGVIKRNENILNLKKNGIIIYINRPMENITKDIDVLIRPLLSKDPSQINKLLEERGHLYKKYCDYEVVNTGSIDDIVNNIIEIHTLINK
ncbi:shikimate kinase [Clostridium bowmanii]|uniref:shikimate kinase n=1 Tax=Clostridium bowmanii TaxID=132925 RepID=UPI001C0E5C3E|nr:shikimate kinase [Clostridium bowmanii]MBU3191462.1 shikimate kinase [Clostridium bowmanii]MCA1075838.1 shikimate kinase [Clostridium bowmanii]